MAKITENAVICNECNKTRRPRFCVTDIKTQNIICVFLVTKNSSGPKLHGSLKKGKGKGKAIPLQAWTGPEVPGG